MSHNWRETSFQESDNFYDLTIARRLKLRGEPRLELGVHVFGIMWNNQAEQFKNRTDATTGKQRAHHGRLELDCVWWSFPHTQLARQVCRSLSLSVAIVRNSLRFSDASERFQAVSELASSFLWNWEKLPQRSLRYVTTDVLNQLTEMDFQALLWTIENSYGAV